MVFFKLKSEVFPLDETTRHNTRCFFPLSQKQMFQERSGRMIQAFSPRGSPSSSPPRDFSPSRSPSPPSRWALPRTSPPSSPKGASASISSMSEGDEDEKWGRGARTHSLPSPRTPHTHLAHTRTFLPYLYTPAVTSFTSLLAHVNTLFAIRDWSCPLELFW